MNRAGAIARDVVEVYRQMPVKTDTGFRRENWQSIKSLKARVIVRRGRQTIDTDEIFDTQIIELCIRKQFNLKESDRIKYFGNMFDIDFIMPDYDRRWLRVRAHKVNE